MPILVSLHAWVYGYSVLIMVTQVHLVQSQILLLTPTVILYITEQKQLLIESRFQVCLRLMFLHILNHILFSSFP